jgi:hypothetical protein
MIQVNKKLIWWLFFILSKICIYVSAGTINCHKNEIGFITTSTVGKIASQSTTKKIPFIIKSSRTMYRHIDQHNTNSRYGKGYVFRSKLSISSNRIDDDENIYTAALNHQEEEEHTATTNEGFIQRPQQRIRNLVWDLAQSVKLNNSIQKTKAATSLFMPQAVAAVIRDATRTAVEMAFEDDTSSQQRQQRPNEPMLYNSLLNAKRVDSLLDEAFLPMEKSLQEMDDSLRKARMSLQKAKQEAKVAMQQIQTTAIDQATAGTVAVVVDKEIQKVKRRWLQKRDSVGDSTSGSSSSSNSSKDIDNQFSSTVSFYNSTFNDIDYSESEMAPPFLGEDQCLVPGEPVVRVEKAPENSRRIFAGIDIAAPVDTVWNVLTNYSNLQNVVPNLVLNDVLEFYNYDNDSTKSNAITVDINEENLSEEEQCRLMCDRMKGSKLRQVGGAKVAGIQFSARTTLEVREWPNGMPDYAHFKDEMYDGKNRMKRAREYTSIPLERYRFPRPFAISSLPTKDISMQSVLNDDGEFRMYQGVWRMQPLVGCAPNGQDAMRLTYAVQISPRAYLPVGLIEGRIVRDLCANLVAVRSYVGKLES